MQFAEVIGQTEVKNHLVDMVSGNRISHALLFWGPEGSGTLSTALAFIKYINCTNKQENDSCGACSNCVKYQKLTHPDLHFVFPINSTEKIKSEKVVCNEFLPDYREAVLANPYLNLLDWLNFIGIENKQGNISEREADEVVRKLSLRAYEAEYKCVIIWMAERMNASSANKLLKILEEPPDKTLFILTAQNHDQLLPTIISRTQLIKFNNVNNQVVLNWLVEEKKTGKDRALEIARQADGNINKALQLLISDEVPDVNFEQFASWMRLCYSKKFEEVLDFANEVGGIGRERQKNFLEYALMMVRECLLRHGSVTDLTRLNQNEMGFVAKFYPFINFRNAQSIMEELNAACFHIERNGNAKIIFLDVSLKLFGLLKQ
jgi:DNA polymerase-3 subunit delta'